MLRDRRKLQDSLRAYRAGEIPAVAGEGEGHFIESIERRLRSLNAELRAKGVVFLGEPADQDWGARLVGCKDPDGNNLYLLQYLG